MAGVFWGVPFAGKHVAQVRAAGVTGNFGAAAVRVHDFRYTAGNFLIKTRPAATRVKFAVRSIEWCVAAAALICAFHKPIIIFTGKRSLGAFMYDDALFFGG